jgi:hypothetical protein
MAGYTRQDTANNIANGNVIDADDFDAEYNQLESAFNASSGHSHDGTAGEGAPIEKVGPSQDLVVSATQVLPKTTNTLDLGSASVQFKDAHFDGTVDADAFTGPLTGNVTGDLTGDVTGDVTGNVTGDLTGDVTGDLTGDVTGNVTGDVTGDVTGTVSDISNHDTDDLSEGLTNLYYTDTRARSSISGTGSLSYNSNTGVMSFTQGDTDTVSEGLTNLYYTDTRARNAVSVTDSGGDGSLAYNSSTGVFTYTGPSASEVRAHISSGTGVTITDGSIAIGQAVGTTSDVTFNDVVVSGDLTVSGTTTTVNTETINLADNQILLNSNETGTPTQNGGIEIERGTETNKTLVWNESDDKWTVGSETFVAGTFEGDLTGDLTGDVTGNADTATTLETTRTISLTGDVTGSATFNGSADASINASLSDTDILKADTDDNLTAGYTATADDDGTKSSGTYTPSPAGGNLKRIINGGAFTLAAPTATGDYTMVIQMTNNSSAGTVTLSGFTKLVNQGYLTTTDGDDFFIYVTKINGFTSLTVQALQ